MKYEYQCTMCGASERQPFANSYVCPWCGDGVMKRHFGEPYLDGDETSVSAIVNQKYENK